MPRHRHGKAISCLSALTPSSSISLCVRSFTTSTPSPSGTPDKVARFSLKRQDKPTFPKQFSATGVHCGIKKNAALDLALILSTSSHPTSAAASFTKNAFQAAPVTVSKQVLAASSHDVRALVVNSGCANAVTGRKGLQNAWAMSKAVQDNLSAYKNKDAPNVLVMSTGVIGQQLPAHRIVPAISSACFPTLSNSFESWEAASKAFMTTDTFPKLRTKEVNISDRPAPIRFAGIDKGAGMIHPRMGPPGPPHATLLGLIATDAAVEASALQEALNYAIDRSFNSISIDGDTSTNDTVAILANGAAWNGQDPITLDGPGYEEFRDALTSFATDLASLVVRDGEGATKFVSINVEECPSYKVAHHIASTLSTSMLLKCAINGQDANWGRVLCAVGYSDPSGFPVDPSTVSVSIGDRLDGQDLLLLQDGEPILPLDEARALELLKREEIDIKVRMGQGSASATYYTCDLSHEYVSINADYRS